MFSCTLFENYSQVSPTCLQFPQIGKCMGLTVQSTQMSLILSHWTHHLCLLIIPRVVTGQFFTSQKSGKVCYLHNIWYSVQQSWYVGANCHPIFCSLFWILLFPLSFLSLPPSLRWWFEWRCHYYWIFVLFEKICGSWTWKVITDSSRPVVKFCVGFTMFVRFLTSFGQAWLLHSCLSPWTNFSVLVTYTCFYLFRFPP